MRTLIIDNYDSFTYNLLHHLAEVTGDEPVVRRNDEIDAATVRRERYDNVIISPGPGRPDRPADFGVCAEVIRSAEVPVLGVCLGHQGICQVFGGTVRRAPQPYHGRISPVVHAGSDILAGLPSPFSAVRYHSLIAEDMSEEIEEIAHTPDGLLMAVRHRHRPLWGVQFHPESVCTEHGRTLLRNFTDLSRSWHERAANSASAATAPVVTAPVVSAVPVVTAAPVVSTAPVASAAPVVPAPRSAPATGDVRQLRVVHRSLDVPVSAQTVYDALYRDSESSFWLDSSGPRERDGRFSFMGDAKGPLARVVRADVWTGEVSVESAGDTVRESGGFFDWLRADLAALRTEVPELPFDFALGWVGYLGYELKAECGGDRAHRSRHPDAAMLFADRAIAFDHREGTVHLLALAEGPGDTRAARWVASTAALLAELTRAPQDPRGSGPAATTAGSLRLRHDRERYLAHIDACLRQIDEGESYEVCLTNMIDARGKLDPADAYRLLRAGNPVPFGAQLRFGGLSVLSCSPERFIRVAGDGTVESRPIKGTRKRAASPAEDAALRADLASNAKDRAENLMIVDLVRNDLGRCARMGSVRVDGLFEVESYATVHQLVSTVSARLRPELSAVDCVRAAFPGGSMTGAPKIRTMQIIDELEDGPRGVYSGALGFFSLSGAADLSIVIRTLVVDGDRIEYGVGGAVIALSDAEAEFEETAVKAAPLLRLLGQEFPGRRSGPAPAGPEGEGTGEPVVQPVS
ncbi:aminodeoxychorismate synthase component I [Streptomyces corynorhini]|uniref:Aminodeoxychorismate synthase n=1 Tax=Streptomyces corynorhini TaxID=2282652 RepID=A0A370BGP6_9ACTN|nr:aminodeoxychorismate synthase component I [Streptomyces corynorhini]RDG39832.1 aminodeoxychorismate synthase component I [Streptomyces corynorhini]